MLYWYNPYRLIAIIPYTISVHDITSWYILYTEENVEFSQPVWV